MSSSTVQFDSAFPVARKEHWCAECHGTIATGERYCRDSGVVDGKPWSHALCLPCNALIRWIWDHHCGEQEVGPVYGEAARWMVKEFPEALIEMPIEMSGRVWGLYYQLVVRDDDRRQELLRQRRAAHASVSPPAGEMAVTTGDDAEG